MSVSASLSSADLSGRKRRCRGSREDAFAGLCRYRSQAEPVMQVICHCKTCQKNSGSAFSINVAVPQDTLELEGDEPRGYEAGVDQADSPSTGNTVRSAAHTSTATAPLTERWRSSRQGHLMTRHGSRHLCTFGAPKSCRGFRFQKESPKFPAIRPDEGRWDVPPPCNAPEDAAPRRHSAGLSRAG